MHRHQSGELDMKKRLGVAFKEGKHEQNSITRPASAGERRGPSGADNYHRGMSA